MTVSDIVDGDVASIVTAMPKARCVFPVIKKNPPFFYFRFMLNYTFFFDSLQQKIFCHDELYLPSLKATIGHPLRFALPL
ncbi:MAG TPA: hypothetical protein DD392_01325 [Ruminococcus sp.]|nr:hypothetical protein [Ruminococcus sp.]